MSVVRTENTCDFMLDSDLLFDEISNDYREVESAINSDLELLDKWYDEYGLKRNNSKYQAIVMGKSDGTLDFKCENSSIPVTKEF